MQYTVDFDIRKFDFWSGARERYEEYEKQGRLDELEQMIEDAFCGCDELPTDTEINDFVWFDEEVNKIFDEDEEEDEE